MNEDELLEGGFESIEQRTQWEAELQAAEEKLQRLDADIAATEQQTQATAPAPPQQVSNTSTQQPTKQQPPQPKSGSDGLDVGNPILNQYLPENVKAGLAAGMGLGDFVRGTLDLIPGVDIQQAPEFEDEVTQTVREISSVVLPTMALGGAGNTGLAAQAAKVKNVGPLKVLSDPFVKWLGSTAFGAGAGAFVDNTLNLSETDDNLAGFLKKTYPRKFGWIPNDLATLDSDSPDVKRGKNVFEGAYLGVGMDMVVGLASLIKRVRGAHKSVNFVPENEKANVWFDSNVEIDKTPEDLIERSAAKRQEALDELGVYNFQNSYNPNEPILGYHDAYGYQEQGIRSVDNLGIVGASIDAARIENDLGTTYGRVGSTMSDAAIKFANESSQNAKIIISGLAETLKDAGEYGYRLDDTRYLTFKQIQDVGAKYANDFYEMDLEELQRSIRPGSIYQGRNVSTGTPELTDEAYSGVMGAIKKYMDDFINMDEAIAKGYIATSLGGQVSDMAQGMRLTEGSGSIQRAQEQILDRVEFLMAQKGMTSYVRGRALNMLNLWNRVTVPGSNAFDKATAKRVENLIKDESNKTLAAIERFKQEAAETTNVLRELKDSNPEILTPLFMAYELTDGNVKTISALNNYVKQSTSIFNKAFIDLQPEIPSVINQAFYANVYNSTLSAAATPIKAGISGSHLLVEKPLRQFAGALVTGDKRTLRRGMYQYSNMLQSITGSLDYAKQIYKRSALDPNVMAVRDDIGLKNQGQLDVLTAFAQAKADVGDFGPQMLMENINAMNDLANHPWLRFGTRSMQAMDGFVQSMIANFEAKGRAFDKFTKNGTVEFDPKAAEDLAADAFAEMFNEKGIITDKAVQRAAGELSFNLDNDANDAISGLIRKMPVLKPFFLFTKTPLNELQYTLTYSPIDPLLGMFVKDMNVFSKSFDDMETGKVLDILRQRGVDVSDPFVAKGKYNELRADILGRKALGGLVTASAIGLFLDDRLHGVGHYNRQVQKTRRESDWQPNSIRGLDDKWYSFEGLGPVTNFLSLVGTIGDNFDVLEPQGVGELFKKLGFVFAASFADKTTMAGVEPFLDVVRGDIGAFNRWASAFITSSTVRGSSQMAEIGRIMDPGLNQINNDLKGMIMNRLPGVKGLLPAKYDWIDGKEVNGTEDIFTRFKNVYTPWKESGKISPEKQFLIDIEYDATAALRTNGKGEPLDNVEQSDILSIMGKQGRWLDGIRRVMNDTEGGGQGFRNRFKDALNSTEALNPDTKNFESIHLRLDDELRDAIGDATTDSIHFTDIERRQYVKARTQDYLRRGKQERAESYLKYTRETFGY